MSKAKKNIYGFKSHVASLSVSPKNRGGDRRSAKIVMFGARSGISRQPQPLSPTRASRRVGTHERALNRDVMSTSSMAIGARLAPPVAGVARANARGRSSSASLARITASSSKRRARRAFPVVAAAADSPTGASDKERVDKTCLLYTSDAADE